MEDKKKLIEEGMCVAVMGLGITGQAAVHYSLACGAQVVVSEDRELDLLSDKVVTFLKANNVELEAGGHTFDFLSRAELVIVSPGIRHDHEVIRLLRDAGVKVVGELAVVAPHLDMPVIAITGTNGKTTVTSLVGEILQEASKKPFVGGNIGTPVLEFLASGKKAETMVLEVSSFQLQMAGDFTPDVGVLLNITPDHIDRHGSLADYAAAKMELFRHQNPEQTAVVSGEDRECRLRMCEMPARKAVFGQDADCDAVISGLRVKTSGECGCFEYDLSFTALGNAIGVRNAAAAILASRALGIDADVIQRVLAKFEPGPHRLQQIGELAGVTFVNDSKATNTGAVMAALKQTHNKVVLIAGGRDKGEKYRLLRESVQDKARAVIVIGEASDQIEAALKDCTKILRTASLEDAVRLGYDLAQPGDTVLLSPACASFDMFKSYGHRGEMFTKAVQALIAEQATVVGDVQ